MRTKIADAQPAPERRLGRAVGLQYGGG
jgi:hypothetical protein